MLARGILGSGRTRGVSFRPFPNSSGWWWLISSIFLIRISCHKTTHAHGYYGAWPGWAVSISVLPLTVGVYIGTATMENSMEFPPKIKNRTTIWFSILLLGTYLKKMKTVTQKDICSSTFIAALLIIDKTWKQLKCPLMDKSIRKNIYTILVYSI